MKVSSKSTPTCCSKPQITSLALLPNAISWQLLGLEDPLGVNGHDASWNIFQPDIVPG